MILFKRYQRDIIVFGDLNACWRACLADVHEGTCGLDKKYSLPLLVVHVQTLAVYAVPLFAIRSSIHYAGFSLASGLEPNQGILYLSCDFTSSIWPRPVGQTSPPVPSTTSSTPATGSSIGDMSSSTRVHDVTATAGALDDNDADDDDSNGGSSFCKLLHKICVVSRIL